MVDRVSLSFLDALAERVPVTRPVDPERSTDAIIVDCPDAKYFDT